MFALCSSGRRREEEQNQKANEKEKEKEEEGKEEVNRIEGEEERTGNWAINP